MTRNPLPRTIRRAVVVATLVAVGGLALYHPFVFPAALAGLFLGASIVWLSGPPVRVTVAATVLPLGLFGVVAAVVAPALDVGGLFTGAGGLYTTVVTLVGALLGLSLVGTVTTGVTERTISNANWIAFVGALLGLAIAGGGYVYATHLGRDSLLLVAGEGVNGFVATVFFAGVSVALAIAVVPNGAVSSPARRELVLVRKKQFSGIVFGIAVILVTLVVLAREVGPADQVSRIAGAPLLRAPLLALGSLGLVGLFLTAVGRWSWEHADRAENDDVPLSLGALVGVTGIVGGALFVGVSPGLVFVVPVLLGVAGVGLWVLRWVLDQFGGHRSLGETVPVALSVVCVVGAIAVGADSGETYAVDSSALGSTLVLGAGLFTYSVGQYGSTLSREIGPLEPERTPQLVQIAFASAVVVLAGLVALGGYWVAMTVAPSVSLPATISLVGALLATVVIARYLWQ